jgi:RND family efflux transporter MFP subunit
MLLLAACGGHRHDEHAAAHEEHAGEIVIAAEQAQAAGIVAEEIRPKSFRQSIAVSGEILPAQGEEQTVVAHVAGVVRFSRQLSTGVQLGRGEALLSISSANMADGSPAERARIAFEAARQEYERAAKLAESRIVAEKELIRIREAYENARLTYEALKADRPSEGGMSVSAPIGGYLKSCLVKEGDYVSVGQPLLTITQGRRLYLRADVPERHYAALKHVQSAHFRTAYSEQVHGLDELNGRLLSYGRAAGEESFYLPVTFEMDSREDLVPGSFAEIWLLSEEMPDVLSVPRTALTEEQGTYAVYVQLDDECYERREVKLGADNGREVELLSGVHAGERVVMQGACQVRLASASKAIPGHSHEH